MQWEKSFLARHTMLDDGCEGSELGEMHGGEIDSSIEYDGRKVCLFMVFMVFRCTPEQPLRDPLMTRPMNALMRLGSTSFSLNPSTIESKT
jgi:hypothetical protein